MELLKTYHIELLIGLITLVVIQFAIVMALSARVNRLSKSLRTLLTGPTGEDLEHMLKRCLGESAQALERGDQLEARQNALSEEMRGCVQHIGLVRYDAYNDISGSQSFSLALLDARQNGAIITGLFGRHDGRCYGKAVNGGQTEQALSEEEMQALQAALQSPGMQVVGAPALNGNGRAGRKGGR